MKEHELMKILSEYQINKNAPIKQIHQRAWDVHNDFILKENDNIDELKKSILLSELLLSMQIPVPEYRKTVHGDRILPYENTYFCLMNKMKGEHIDPYQGDCYHNGKLLGKIVANLHLALKNIKFDFDIRDADFMKELTDWIMPEVDMQQIIFSKGVIDACFSFKKLYETLPRQLIHRDMHLENLLFQDGRFLGYLDFDISQKNARLVDICYLGTSMLVGNFSDANRLMLWQEVFKGVLNGYGEISILTENEKKAIPIMFVFIEVLFTAFFSKNNQPQIAQSCVDMANWVFENMSMIQMIVEE